MNSFFDRAKNIAVDLASRSKAAAQLTVRQATRTKIASLDLPRAFAALGKHLYATGTNRDEFASLYQHIDKLNGDIEAIEAASKTGKQGMADKARSIAIATKDKVQIKALQHQVSQDFAALGKVAYETHHDASGPEDLVQPISDCESRISVLDADIISLSSAPAGTIVTPKRIAIAGVVVVGLAMLGLVGRFADEPAGVLKSSESVTAARSRSETVTRRGVEKTEPVGEVFKGESVTNSIGMELIEIPVGTFTMGSPAGEKGRSSGEDQISLTLTKSFRLGKYEVTQGQYQSVMASGIPWGGVPQTKADTDCPATFVEWDEAIEFCLKLTATDRKSRKLGPNEKYRLPTTEEWEYACRAGTTTAFSFGDDESKLGEYAWFVDNAMNAGYKYVHKVGLKKPNPWGLYDMHGNVWEWCSNWFGGDLSGGADPTGPSGGSDRVIRGGSWMLNPGLCRSANRGSDDPSRRLCDLGFRVARSQVGKGLKPGQTITNSIGMELIGIPAGTFTMGDGAGVAVTLTQGFSLGKTEVSWGEWQQVMGKVFQGQKYAVASKDFPLFGITWDEAIDFCKKLTATEHKNGKLPAGESYRLPTEAEWEYACRAGTTTAFSFGDDKKQLGEYGWFNGNTIVVHEQYAHKVGLKKPNPWGLHDMHGNACEWCSDSCDDKGEVGVVRGGAFPHEARSCRSAGNGCSRTRAAEVGFRVALVHY